MASDQECVVRKQETAEVGVLQYQDLIVWQKAMDLVIRVYELSDGFPRRETFGLTNQLRRSAISIPSNIAEGQARQTTRDFLRFLSIAQGSSQELETQILIAFRLSYLKQHEKNELVGMLSEVGRLLSGLTRSLRRTECPNDSPSP
jgi:four helix bundle protein